MTHSPTRADSFIRLRRYKSFTFYLLTYLLTYLLYSNVNDITITTGTTGTIMPPPTLDPPVAIMPSPTLDPPVAIMPQPTLDPPVAIMPPPTLDPPVAIMPKPTLWKPVEASIDAWESNNDFFQAVTSVMYRVRQNKISQRENRDIYTMQEYFYRKFSTFYSSHK